VSILFVLIPLGLVLVGFAAWAFFWAVNHGQFDDLDTPAIAILADDECGGRGTRDHSSATPSEPTAPGALVTGAMTSPTGGTPPPEERWTRGPR